MWIFEGVGRRGWGCVITSCLVLLLSSQQSTLFQLRTHPHTLILPACACVQAPRKFTSGIAGKMGYEDFVWFILSEEDKTTDTAIEYWFR
jgi:hypothetical protein